jgi:membrane-bound lytic murein transglycosylase F
MAVKMRLSGLSCMFLALCLCCTEPVREDFLSAPTVSVDLDAIKKRGYITALVDNNSISYFIYKGRAMGYEYELLQFMANELGVELKIKVTSGINRAIDQLNKGEGDVIAFPLTVNKPRKNAVEFTKPHFNTYQVLVQRKPDNWRKLGIDEINERVIRNAVELDGKNVHVIQGTSYEMRLHNLNEEMGTNIIIKEDTLTAESESLIRKVALGEIDYTVADHTMAQVNASYYPNLDVSTVLSVPQQIAWAVRKNAPQLKEAIDTWMSGMKRSGTYMVLYNRYFKSPRTSLIRMNSDYSSLNEEGKISPYDDLIKEGAVKLGWDWRLLASVVYQESQFISTGVSWAGARGLMQLMPETAKHFGATNIDNPTQNLKAGVKFLKYLDDQWKKTIPDGKERLKFVLASYNAGLTHVTDARKLAEKYNKNPNVWDDNVEYYLLKKSDPKFYRDPSLVAGYCKCEEPVNYVRNVLERFEEYKIHYPS